MFCPVQNPLAFIGGGSTGDTRGLFTGLPIQELHGLFTGLLVAGDIALLVAPTLLAPPVGKDPIHDC